MDRQWDQLKKLEQSHLSLEEVYVEKKKTDPNEAISWELYKNLTYGYITGEFKSTLHQGLNIVAFATKHFNFMTKIY